MALDLGIALCEFVARWVEAMVEQLPVDGCSRGGEKRCNGGFGTVGTTDCAER